MVTHYDWRPYLSDCLRRSRSTRLSYEQLVFRPWNWQVPHIGRTVSHLTLRERHSRQARAVRRRILTTSDFTGSPAMIHDARCRLGPFFERCRSSRSDSCGSSGNKVSGGLVQPRQSRSVLLLNCEHVGEYELRIFRETTRPTALHCLSKFLDVVVRFLCGRTCSSLMNDSEMQQRHIADSPFPYLRVGRFD